MNTQYADTDYQYKEWKKQNIEKYVVKHIKINSPKVNFEKVTDTYKYKG